MKTRLDEFPLVELGDDFLFLVQSKSSYSWNSASLKSLKDWLLKNISVEALQLWCGPWDNYSEAVSKYALSAGAGKNLYDLIAILNRDCQNNFNSLTHKILAETSARKTADSNLQTGIDNVNSLIPSVASTTNQLADKEFVNSSIANSTATFRGTFETINDLPTSNVKKNDYAFVIAVSNGNPEYRRYKYNGEAWAFEYTLNNSSFTSKQWAAITSGITTDKVSSYDTHIFNKSNPHGVTKEQVGLGNVENVAISTWKGSTNITTLGVITTGTWQGTKIANAYLANSSITIGTTKFNLGDAKTAIEGLTSLLFSGASGALTYNKTGKYYSLADNLVVNGILASGTSGTGGAAGYSQVEWADIQKMTGSVSGSLASAYAVKESYSALNTIVSTKADKITLDAVTKRVTSLENKYTAVTTDIANHIGNTTVHITSAERIAWNNKQAAISDLATIRSNAATAYDWGDHSKAGYITGITKAMVEGVLTGNITSHTHSYIPLADKGLSDGKVPYYVIFPSYNTLVSLGYNEASTVTEDEYYFKGLCKWAIDNFPNQGHLILTGNAQPNSIGYCRIELYSNHGKDANTGLPRYCSGTYLSLNNVTTNFVCRNYMWSWGGTFNGDASTASKWTNARTITLTGSVTGSVSIDGSSNVSLDTTTNHTHTFASLALKPTTLSGYGITDASRIFRYNIPASGNKGVRVTFTSGEPVKITVSGANGGAQLVLVGTGHGAGGFLRNNFTELVQSTSYYTWCLADEACSVEVFSVRTTPDIVTVESPSPVTFTAISALSTNAAYRHLLTSENYSKWALPLTGGTINGLLTITANANYGLTVNSILKDSQAAGINFQINGTTYGRVLVKNTKELLYNDMTKTYTVYHSGNSNNTDTVWSAKRLATPDNLICPYTWEKHQSPVTGTLVLSLPYGFNSMMQCIELTVYDYSSTDGSQGATKFFINGYNYSGNYWINPYVFRIGNKNVKVRLGYYNNKCCILIGETKTGWNYPRICVDKVYGSFGKSAYAYKDDDWSCAVLQDESQITHVKTASDTPLYAPCYTRSGLPYVTDNDVAAKYLKLTGGTMTGDAAISWGINDRTDWSTYVSGIRVMSSVTADSGAPVQYATGISVMARYSFQIAAKGGNADNFFMRAGNRDWKEIYHAGNCNLPTIPWTCSSLTANLSVKARRGEFGYIEFSNIDSSANHGGYLDFHFNGDTADYTTRIIEDAAGQLTLIASTVKATGDVKTSGWCKATNGLLIEESGVYYTHHSLFGEIDMVKGNEFIWGSKTDTLYFNYRASANETTTVAHYIWNAGSPTTYATHTMGTLTVLGAITATTTIHATTGIYTDGYISAKQASASSDRRLKKDFCKIDNALKYVLKTHYTRFRWKDDNKESIGIIAQEEQNREYGFLVQNNEKIGHLTYDYAASTALLGAAIQEEDSKVEKLKKRVAELEKELSNLKRKWQH